LNCSHYLPQLQGEITTLTTCFGIRKLNTVIDSASFSIDYLAALICTSRNDQPTLLIHKRQSIIGSSAKPPVGRSPTPANRNPGTTLSHSTLVVVEVVVAACQTTPCDWPPVKSSSGAASTPLPFAAPLRYDGMIPRARPPKAWSKARTTPPPSRTRSGFRNRSAA